MKFTRALSSIQGHSLGVVLFHRLSDIEVFFSTGIIDCKGRSTHLLGNHQFPVHLIKHCRVRTHTSSTPRILHISHQHSTPTHDTCHEPQLLCAQNTKFTTVITTKLVRSTEELFSAWTTRRSPRCLGAGDNDKAVAQGAALWRQDGASAAWSGRPRGEEARVCLVFFCSAHLSNCACVCDFSVFAVSWSM